MTPEQRIVASLDRTVRGPLSSALGATLTVQGTFAEKRGGGLVGRITYQMNLMPANAGTKIDAALRSINADMKTSVLDMPGGTVVTYQDLPLGDMVVSGSVSQQENTLTVVAQSG